MSNIILAKVKFERNLKNIPFTHKMTTQQQEQLLNTSLAILNEIGLKAEKVENISDTVINSLLKDNIMEQEFIDLTSTKGFGYDNQSVVQINGRNHIEIIGTDDNILTAFEKAKNIDKQLCSKLNFAYSDKYGFLNPDLQEIGTGMSITAILLLPALNKLGAVKRLPKSMDKLMFRIECLDAQSGLYVINSGANLGYTERQICELATSYIDNIVKCEIDASKTLSKDIDEVLDKYERAKAIINSCVKITPEELQQLLGDILIASNGEAVPHIDISPLTKCLNNNDNKELAKIIKNKLK